MIRTCQRLARSPRLLTWVARVADIRTALTDVPGAAGEPVQVSRGTLSWQISIPPDGSLPLGGAFPTLIQWPDRTLRGLSMPDLGCRLERLSIKHPHGASLAELLKPFFADDRVVILNGAEVELRAAILTPLGPRELG
jgi:Glyoxalase-like domain